MNTMNTMVCAQCAAPAALMCAQCRRTRYCARTCQIADWNTHKTQCARTLAITRAVDRVHTTILGNIACAANGAAIDTCVIVEINDSIECILSVAGMYTAHVSLAPVAAVEQMDKKYGHNGPRTYDAGSISVIYYIGDQTAQRAHTHVHVGEAQAREARAVFVGF